MCPTSYSWGIIFSGKHPTNTTTWYHVHPQYLLLVFQLNQIKIMVERGSMDLSEVDEQGKTVLHVAAGYRHCHEVGERPRDRCNVVLLHVPNTVTRPQIPIFCQSPSSCRQIFATYHPDEQEERCRTWYLCREGMLLERSNLQIFTGARCSR